MGAKILKKLDSSPVQIDAAFWVKPEEGTPWKFVMHSPLVEQRGIRHTYRQLQTAVGKSPLLPARAITLVGLEDLMLNVLRSAIVAPQLGDYGWTRIKAGSVNGYFFEDLVIYRL